VSLSTGIGDDGGELVDLLADPTAVVPEDAAVLAVESEALRASLSRLRDRERAVIELRYGFLDGSPRTLEEVGRSFAVTRERARQIEAKALTKLRHPSVPKDQRSAFRRATG
jgi:RNA polymerase primary sigma factor